MLQHLTGSERLYMTAFQGCHSVTLIALIDHLLTRTCTHGKIGILWSLTGTLCATS